jgi:hypothetical protein
MKLKFIFRTLNAHDLKIREHWNGKKMKRFYGFGIVTSSNLGDLTYFTEVYLLDIRDSLIMTKYFLNQQSKL